MYKLYRLSDKGGGGGHPNPEIRGGAVSKNFFQPFRLQFGLKIRGTLPWIRQYSQYSQ